MGMSPERSERPTAFLVGIALAVPLLATIVGLVLLGTWWHQLPDPLASHWGAGGAADGFTSRTAVLAAIPLIGAVFALVAAVLIRVTDDPTTCAYVVSGTAGISTFLYVLILAAVGVQRGVTAADSRFPGWWAAIAAGIAVVSAATAYLLTPRWSATGEASQPTSAVPLPVGATERVVWTRSVLSGGAFEALTVSGVLVVAVGAVLTNQWWMLSVAGIIVLIFVVLRGMRVTVDAEGLSVRSVVRWPRVEIPVSDIAAAQVVEVKAVKDFGGYGYRLGFRGELKGVKGFVLRSGEGILVDRISGAREIVVVDDAKTAVRLLETYRLRGDSAAA